MNSTKTIRDLEKELKDEKKKLDKVRKKIRIAKTDDQMEDLEVEWYAITDKIAFLNLEISKLRNIKDV